MPIWISIGILAWNEEEAIGLALQSLFAQSIFAHLQQRGHQCEIICVANGCTDQTAAIAGRVFQDQSQNHPFREAFSCRALNLPERGKINAWNTFVHGLSAKDAEVLFLMDGDIVLQEPETLWSMYTSLCENSEAQIATDHPLKDISLKPSHSFREKISVAASRMTQGGAAQVTGQLYGIRASVARKIYLPRDLVACEDGFIKAVTCTDFLSREVAAERVVAAPQASHIFQAYTRFSDILRNQKRQVIGQTIVHLLVDIELQKLSAQEKSNLGETLRAREQSGPDWLKKRIAAHLRKARFFWRLFPDLLTFRFRRLAKLHGGKRLFHLPAALAGFLVTMWAAWLAWRFLKQGSTQYWPDTRSPHLQQITVSERDRTRPLARSAA